LLSLSFFPASFFGEFYNECLGLILFDKIGGAFNGPSGDVFLEGELLELLNP
jgi:hypothetical protein